MEIFGYLHGGILGEGALPLPTPPNPTSLTHTLVRLTVLTCKDLVKCTLPVWGAGQASSK